MATLNKETPRTQIEGGRRASRATVAGTSALLLAPVAGWAGSTASSLVLAGVDPTSDLDAFLAAVAANIGLWNTFSVLMLVIALLTVAWVPAVWRLTVDRTPRCAWTTAVIGTLFAMGQFVHLVSWNVLSAGLAESVDGSAALAVVEAMEASWFFVLIFAPFLLGALLAAPIAAVALRRARLLPTWSVVVVVAASIVTVILGTDNPIGVAAYSVLLITGFTPALVRVLRGRAS
ncbi:hypothetical protein [Salinibacterium sp. ZJ450]|uniref:hypothetical protein n=1 Tax=Salinibacterium sp. ZJ450 TaxID=2708338 RepID=UPI00141F17CB|nr:hypothetical protein [Salinibacterium sp. ZJ450]